MGRQLALPAGWAWQLSSRRDPHTRLQELRRDQTDAKAEIRIVLDRLAEKYGVAAKDVNLGMLSVDDTLSDLIYAAQSDLEAEIEQETQP